MGKRNSVGSEAMPAVNGPGNSFKKSYGTAYDDDEVIQYSWAGILKYLTTMS